MAIPGLNRMTVWLDELAPGQGTFAHALDWATMLHLPLHACVATGRNGWPLPTQTIAACESSCSWNGVSWSHSWDDPDHCSSRYPERLADGLLVLGGAIPPAAQRRLFREAVNRAQVGPLLCSRSWGYLRRALVINEGRTPGRGYLEAVAWICRSIAAPVAVLTLAHADGDARRQQQMAEEVFASRGVKADFHVVVGSDLLTGVSVVANWRRCSHLFIEKNSVSPVKRWLGRPMEHCIFELSDSFSVLPIPALGSTSETDFPLTGTGSRSGMSGLPVWH